MKKDSKKPPFLDSLNLRLDQAHARQEHGQYVTAIEVTVEELEWMLRMAYRALPVPPKVRTRRRP